MLRFKASVGTGKKEDLSDFEHGKVLKMKPLVGDHRTKKKKKHQFQPESAEQRL